MNLGPLTTMMSGFAIAALGLTVGLATPARAPRVTLDAATVVATAMAKAPARVLLNCSDEGVAEPSSYIITCADAGMRLKGLHWTTWSPRFASAYGTFTENDCQPSCAAGHFRNYPVIVTAWGSKSVAGHASERAYTEFTATFPGGSHPPLYELAGGKVVATYPVIQLLPAA
jgi:hypothetical protein